MNNGNKLRICSLPIKQDVRQNEAIASCLMPFFGSLVAVLLGVICQKNVTVHGKQSIVVSVNGEIRLLVAIFQALQVEADFENLSIDSTSVKAHQHSAGAKKTQKDTK